MPPESVMFWDFEPICAPNNEVERRGVAATQNEARLTPPPQLPEDATRDSLQPKSRITRIYTLPVLNRHYGRSFRKRITSAHVASHVPSSVMGVPG